MDRDSYSKPELARVIKDRFVAVKVDYDLQPEIAARLQQAQAFMNLPVGLPLTASLVHPENSILAGATSPQRPGWETVIATDVERCPADVL
jgi:uncharacterized protein YyaL (SSP411 family)